jgi:hypothetical protein
MIGLLFLFVIGLWVWIAVKLGTKIPQWLGATRYRTAFGVVLVPLIFMAPVADEIIAYPQMRALCAAGGYQLAMTEKEAQGRTIYSASYETSERLWPPTVEVARMKINYVDAATNQSVIAGYGYVRPLRGFLGVPAGGSGDKMPVILSKCGLTNIEPRDQHGIPLRFDHLKLNLIPTP